MLTFIPSRSCYYKIPWEYFVPTALQFFATWIPLRIICHTFRVSAHPNFSGVSKKSLKYYSILRKSLAALLLCKYLSTSIMDASHISGNIHLYLLTPSFWSYWFNMCANAHNHLSTLLTYLSDWDIIFEHELVLDQTICRQLCLWSIQLIHPWSKRLLLILCFGNRNSFVI